MRKLLTPALIAASALLLYNCTGDDTEPLDPAAELTDTLQPGDSVYSDTITYPGNDYPISDTAVQDSVAFPTDTISGDTITVTEPYPGDPDTPVTDTVYTPTDSVSGERVAHPRQQYLNRSFDHRKKP
jgi:hypothetical protein